MSRQPTLAAWLITLLALFWTVECVSVPSCQVTAPQQKTLDTVRATYLTVPKFPFGLVYMDNDIALVALNTTLGVLNTTTSTPSLLHQIPFPDKELNVREGGALGIALTSNHRHLLVSSGFGALVIDVAMAVKGSSAAIIGRLEGPAVAGDGAIEVTITADGQYAFVSQEYGSSVEEIGNVEVINLHKPAANGSISATYIGYLALGDLVVGTAFSPNGSILYATSETLAGHLGTGQGSLSVLDVEVLKKNPSQALLSNTTAGCGAVRIIVSQDGKIVWVTARESNHLLAFDAARLVSHPGEALIASVQVGQSPVGLTFAKNESRILTADSNRFNFANSTSGLSVVNVSAALHGRDAVLGRIPSGKPTGSFPREFALSPDDSTILVSDYEAKMVQAVKVATIP